MQGPKITCGSTTLKTVHYVRTIFLRNLKQRYRDYKKPTRNFQFYGDNYEPLEPGKQNFVWR